MIEQVLIFFKLGVRALEMLQAPRYLNSALSAVLCSAAIRRDVRAVIFLICELPPSQRVFYCTLSMRSLIFLQL